MTRVTLVPSAEVAGDDPVVEPAGRGGAIIERATCPRRTGVPVSAATTRPRMIPVPVGSGGGRLPGSLTCPCAGGTGGGGGGTWPAPKLNAKTTAVRITLDSFRQV
jgi:hypothetical protein